MATYTLPTNSMIIDGSVSYSNYWSSASLVAYTVPSGKIFAGNVAIVYESGSYNSSYEMSVNVGGSAVIFIRTSTNNVVSSPGFNQSYQIIYLNISKFIVAGPGHQISFSQTVATYTYRVFLSGALFRNAI